MSANLTMRDCLENGSENMTDKDLEEIKELLREILEQLRQIDTDIVTYCPQ